MKYEELQYERLGDANETYPASTLVIRKQFVDSAIDELKREHHRERHEYIEMVAQHKAKLVEQESENRRLKRALWLARADRANAEWGHWATIWFCDTNVELNINKSSVSQEPYRCTTKRNSAIWRNMWSEVERKCRAKAEE